MEKNKTETEKGGREYWVGVRSRIFKQADQKKSHSEGGNQAKM